MKFSPMRAGGEESKNSLQEKFPAIYMCIVFNFQGCDSLTWCRWSRAWHTGGRGTADDGTNASRLTGSHPVCHSHIWPGQARCTAVGLSLQPWGVRVCGCECLCAWMCVSLLWTLYYRTLRVINSHGIHLQVMVVTSTCFCGSVPSAGHFHRVYRFLFQPLSCHPPPKGNTLYM